MGTHSTILQFSDGSRAYIDGIPDKCEHKETDDVFQTSSGKMIFWHTYRQLASLPGNTRYELIIKYHDEIGDPIIMCTSQCRKCKKIDFPNNLDYQDI